MIARFWKTLKEDWVAYLVVLWLVGCVIFGLVEMFGRFLLWLTVIKTYFA